MFVLCNPPAPEARLAGLSVVRSRRTEMMGWIFLRWERGFSVLALGERVLDRVVRWAIRLL